MNLNKFKAVTCLVSFLTAVPLCGFAETESATVPGSPAPGSVTPIRGAAAAVDSPVGQGVMAGSDRIDSATADSQPTASAPSLAAYTRMIESLKENGPYYLPSSELLYDLAVKLQDGGYHGRALKILQRAMHVHRVNDGLYSLSQAPMLKAMIDSRKALNLFSEVTEDYHRLLGLHLKNQDSFNEASLEILRELAAWHVDAYLVDEGDSRIDHLTTAHSLISVALRDLDRIPDLATETRIEALRTAALVSFYLTKHQGDEWVSAVDSMYSSTAGKSFYPSAVRAATLSHSGFRNGRQAHEHIIALLSDNRDARPEQLVDAYIEAGDWQLMFNNRDNAMAYYQRAFALLESLDSGEALLSQRFGNPVLLPASKLELAPDETATLYVTAELNVSARGAPDNISIVKAGTKSDRHIRRAAYETLKMSRFRPRFVDGVAVDTKEYVYKFPLVR
ncbi:MAG TPA: hypothetical protein DCZ13_07405 [Porticoccaceae bacterium]|nr:hypothetical protein [Porticoccaceae bacterium]